MMFTTKEDVDVPIGPVFDDITNFDRFERQFMRRGAEVRRVDAAGGVPGVGAAWDIGFAFRGKPRVLRASLVEYDRPDGYVLDTVSEGLAGKMTIDLLALSRDRTRIAVSIALTPTSIGARLLVQSFKLGKSQLNSRFKLRVADFAADVEKKFRKSAKEA